MCGYYAYHGKEKEEKMKYIITSESVGAGHPDKVCDRISDRILTEILKQDKNARVAVECLVTTNFLIISGEVTTTANIDYEQVARDEIKNIGYVYKDVNFCYDTVQIVNKIHTQSPDIAMGVDIGGAGDQGIMFGYATDETDCYLPTPIYYAHKLINHFENLNLWWKRPDMKSQVSVEYEDDKPVRIDTVVVSIMHSNKIDIETLRKEVTEEIKKVVPIDEKTKIFINPTGSFVIGGPDGDTGLTGRKIIVDTYGGVGHHGGGAFSGKDPSKVDRSAAYMARYIAKNIVANKLAHKCEIQLGYAIGVEQPVSVFVNTFGTEQVDIQAIYKYVNSFDMTPKGIIKTLDLKNTNYVKTASGGHFGRNEFTWEQVKE